MCAWWISALAEWPSASDAYPAASRPADLSGSGAAARGGSRVGWVVWGGVEVRWGGEGRMGLGRGGVGWGWGWAGVADMDLGADGMEWHCVVCRGMARHVIAWRAMGL